MEPAVSSDESGSSTAGLLCHYQFENGTSQFVFLRFDTENVAISIDHSLGFYTKDYVQIISSSNGLLLLSSLGEDCPKYHVFDPSTKKSVTLSPPCLENQIISSGLAFDGLSCYYVVFVCLDSRPNPDSGSLKLEIFSSEKGKWRSISPCKITLNSPLSDAEFPELRTHSVFSNGAIYFEIAGKFLVYNVQDDSFRLIDLPNAQEDWCWPETRTYKRCLWELDGRVQYSYADETGVHTWDLLNDQDHGEYLDIFSYEKERFQWRLVYSIGHEEFMTEQIENLLRLGSWEPYYISPVAYLEHFRTMLLRLPGVVVSYDVGTQVMKEICSFTFPGKDYSCCSFFPIVYAGKRSLGAQGKQSDAEEKIKLPLTQVLPSMSF